MIRIALVGGIGSGKTFISKLFRYPVFNADKIVGKIYSKNKKIYFKLKKKLPNIFNTFPIKKEELIKAISQNKNNIKRITEIIHPEVRKELKKFIKENNKRNAVILDIPLFLESKLNKKKDIIIFIQSSNKEALKRIKKRKNFNNKILQKLIKLQLPLSQKKRKSHYIIKNNFNENLARKNVKDILNKILK
tara:strand:- start:686 stop:1258 length:573 start_codon:yes stop_codon:yes gene_type:complete